MSSARLAAKTDAKLLTDCRDLYLLFNSIQLIDTTDTPAGAHSHCDWRLLVTEEDNLPCGFARSRESRGFKDADPYHRNIDFEYDHIPYALQQTYLKILNNLEVKQHLLEQANQFCARYFDGDTVSIHMRTWMTDSWDQAPKRHAAFFDIDQYSEIIEKHLPAKIFLSSDNAQYASQLVKHFGPNLLVFPPQRHFEPLELAFINLLLLSKNSLLYGSKISTFTEMAWWYSGCKSSVTLL
jgi:hypothetical protein